MRRAWIFAAAALLVAAHGHAQWSIEADLNGVLGDPQPDSIAVAVGQDFPVDIWLLTPSNSDVIALGIILCEPGAALDYQYTVYGPDPCPGWTYLDVPPPPQGECAVLQGVNFSFPGCIWPPTLIATVTYRAAVEGSLAELTLGEGSGVFADDGMTHYFTNNGSVIARIQIGDVTATETTSWGSIKTLFR